MSLTYSLCSPCICMPRGIGSSPHVSMPPRKRDDNDADSNAQGTPIPAKRQRVSLACDSCRTAREKCDGGRPNCGTCIAQNRTCSYTPASRKRGVQTGYLRTIELSLAWLFEQVPECEGALHRLLTQNEGADGIRILGTKDKAGHRLYRRWNKSRVHKDIGRLLSEDKTPRSDTSAEDTETEGDTSPATSNQQEKPSPIVPGQGVEIPQSTPQRTYAFRPSSIFPSLTRLILPRNWQRLIDIYFSYTHCWFPIVERDTITSTALTYPPEGIATGLDVFLPASHAQLWAVLAIAAFQNSASSCPSVDCSISPARIFAISRRLIPNEDEHFEAPHICALLLQSLALLGQRRQMAAWLLIGKASRLAVHHRGTPQMDPSRGDREDVSNDPKLRLVAASFVLDTLASLSLGHPQVPSGACANLPRFTSGDASEGDEVWTSMAGFGSGIYSEEPSQLSQALPIFQQLLSFCRLWSNSMESQLQDNRIRRRITPEDLVKGLDTRFSFWNSLIFGGSTPIIPSAFLLQVMFLTITLDLVPGYRPSLFSNLMEVIDSCLENFGPAGTPPIFVTLMEIVQRHRHLDRMHEHDKTKWNKARDRLYAVWNVDLTESVGLEEHQTTGSYLDAMGHPMTNSTFMDDLSTTNYEPSHGTPNISGMSAIPAFSRLEDPKDLPLLQYDRQRYPILGHSPNASQPMHAATPILSFQSPILQGEQTIPGLQSSGIQDQMVDYDAILEELGSIDCADSLDVDPQFMANLGFAPGCDLGEMFQGDFGM